MRLRPILFAFALTAAAPALAQPRPAKPLFASDAPIHLTIRGPLDTLASNAEARSGSYPGTLTEDGGAALPIALEVRGITRRQRDVCTFPPLRVTFTAAPPAGSLFAGQRRLKLVTHCQSNPRYQDFYRLEYTGYRLYNLLTPYSMRARLAEIDYQDGAGRPLVHRIGFFLEDIADVAARNGMREARMDSRIPVRLLSAPDAARFALFEYMISNYDWALQAAPAGDECCHNNKLIGPAGAASASVIPVPYDFDFSGMVDAPYALPPAEIGIGSTKQRKYRGFCLHNAEARAALPAFRAQQGAILATFAAIPGLDPGAARKAQKFVAGFFADIATDERAEAKLFATCLKP